MFANLSKGISIFSLILVMLGSIAAQDRHPAEISKTARTIATTFETTIEFRNQSNKTLKLFWLDENGQRKFTITLAPKQNESITTFLSQPWLVTDDRDNALSLYYPDAQLRIVVLSDAELEGRSRDDFDYDYDDPNVKYDTKPISICANQEIPRGFVIVSAGSEWECPNWSVNGSISLRFSGQAVPKRRIYALTKKSPVVLS